MRTAIITATVACWLGEDAALLGFILGALVNISRTTAGSLLVVLNDEPVILEAKPKAVRPGSGTPLGALYPGTRRA